MIQRRLDRITVLRAQLVETAIDVKKRAEDLHAKVISNNIMDDSFKGTLKGSQNEYLDCLRIDMDL